ncbi:DUF58 domain-containing protein [Steroidobacter sp. S1-65]|uniref:DUF58 domain-containing protein n=1 Tax=Steroidobacter gossypii TaxID=2805490 RepID=A0ABS1X034_9GAMM|nr:DUF58 domain-containing protein [Steroidobacter gossypii]MBM0106573.1 DUF58 domain-containing protein [Steroidobacter gossypii]
MAEMSAQVTPMPSAPTALLQRLEWRARHAVNTTVSGEYRSAFRGRGMEFDQVVKYQWGDDPRDIDWNVTARLGEPYRKRFVEERDLTVTFIFEDSPALQFGSEGRTRRETLLETAALLMLIGAINRDRVALLYSAPGKSWFQRALPGRKGIMRVAAMLLGQPAPSLGGPASCPLPWSFVKKTASRGSVLLWFGPFAPQRMPELWRELHYRHQAVGVRADDPWDVELPRNERLSAYDPLAGRLTLLNTSSSAERAAHAAWRERRDAYFMEMFPRSDDRLVVRNEDDPLQALVAWFHRHRHGGARA